MTKRCFLVLTIVMLLCGCTQPLQTNLPHLSNTDSTWIGERIFANECNLKTACLTSWNVGEDFPSLGIGHFIWYRENQREAFVESFPLLLAHYDEREAQLPAWINALPGRDSPWQTRAEFLADQDSLRMQELRNFLNDTKHIQVEFIIKRMHDSLPVLVSAAEKPDEITALFHEIANSTQPLGMYALIDYINFKGDGTAASERYQGEGWGLLQALEHLLANRNDSPLMSQFADATRYVLARRIDNSPAERGEERWRLGWNNRVSSYATLPDFLQ